MKNKILSFLVVSLISLTLVRPVYAQSFARSGERVVVDKEETVNHDYFAAGTTVVIEGTINGDAYVAGENVVIAGVIMGDLLAAGKNIEVTGTVQGDVRAAGETINITGSVDGNITTGGRKLVIEKRASVKGSVVGGAEEMVVLGPIGKSVTAGVKTLTIDNNVGGDINYWSSQDISKGEDASFSGKITRHDLPQPDSHTTVTKKQAVAGAAGISLFGAISLFVIGAILLKLFPVYGKQVVEGMHKNPWGLLGRGFLYTIGIPVGLVLLMVTIIGIPVSIIGFVIYGLATGAAKLVAAFFIGQSATRLVSMKVNEYGQLALGVVLSAIMGMIPVFGWLALTAIYLMAFASLIAHHRDLHNTLRSKKLV